MTAPAPSAAPLPRPIRIGLRLLACWLLVTGSVGCLSRRMMITSQPEGALVLLDGEEVGYTPVAVDFTYYGTREITLIKDGYETLTVLQDVDTPWYQIPPLDFFSDNLLLTHATDRRQFNYVLHPAKMTPTQDLLGRGNSLRSEARIGP